MNNLAIIPARGGSKRIPRKNIRDFLGKPILAYSIEKALNSGFFDEVMVSTEDEEIAEVAMKYGAEIPFLRSEKNADDYATLSDVIEEVKEQYLAVNKEFEYICCILATAPLLKISDLKRGYHMLSEREVDSVRPVVQFPYPIQRALRLQNGLLEMINKNHQRTRSQDLETAFYDAAQFYWMNFDKGLNGDNKAGFEIPKQFAQDIDDEEDWIMAELKYRTFHKK